MRYSFADALTVSFEGKYAFSKLLERHFHNFSTDEEPSIRVRFVKVDPGDQVLGENFEYDSKRNLLIYRKFRYARIAVEPSVLRKGEGMIYCDPNFAWAGLQAFIEDIVRETLSDRGVCMVHSSCLSYRGRTLFFPAWSNTGKTTMVLHLLKNGASLLGDDRVFVRDDGSVAHFAIPINVLAYNIRMFPGIVKIPPHRKMLAAAGYRIRRSLRKPTFLNEAAHFAIDAWLEGRRSLQPWDLFPGTEIAKDGVPRSVFCLTKHSGADIVMRKMSSDDAIERILGVYSYEWGGHWERILGGFNYFSAGLLEQAYDRRNKRVESLRTFLDDKEIHEVLVPSSFNP